MRKIELQTKFHTHFIGKKEFAGLREIVGSLVGEEDYVCGEEYILSLRVVVTQSDMEVPKNKNILYRYKVIGIGEPSMRKQLFIECPGKHFDMTPCAMDDENEVVDGKCRGCGTSVRKA